MRKKLEVTGLSRAEAAPVILSDARAIYMDSALSVAVDTSVPSTGTYLRDGNRVQVGRARPLAPDADLDPSSILRRGR